MSQTQESEARRQIEISIEALEDLRSQFDQLLCGQNSTYIQFCEELDRDAAARRDEVGRVHSEEIASAHRVLEGFLDAEDHNHAHESLGASGNVLDIIRCKYSLVKSALPRPTEYFALFTKCPFIRTLIGQSSVPRVPSVSVTLTKDPICEKPKGVKHVPKTCSVRGGYLTIGSKVFDRGSQAVLVVGKGRPIVGTIASFKEGGVEFDADGQTVRVPMIAFSFHQCKLKKR